ncbi:hypothetical protein VOLCADRAFT_100966 [Volvox carteri f. nagariensis]|uniref:Uncharacterized protein n=1 Tax=Volvox carteri f. nagariensis TaxID=3068 RepID=D8ULF7_VOLCA|nr:uncharacterized protein VOLCADRAFT_100966 [Volvox carteri f. nagariensis]EFJ39442.1 hypothetical protein VOLCADRAFT_100966 [Volvox carteri f. nagariensis]|eukprot:XP_002959493.1 hypothetical protein VOLCADRAFT_100966 [Volvox carteri f. nagariensis]
MGATFNRRMCSVATIAPNGRDGEQADVQRGYHRAQWARRSTGGRAAWLPSRPMGATVNRQMCGAATIAPNGRDGQQADVRGGYHRAQWARRSTGGCVRRLPSRPMGATVNRQMCEAATIAPNGRDGQQADVRRGYHRAQWARRSTGGCAARLPSRPMGATVNRRMCEVATIAPNGRDGEQADVRRGYHRAQWARRSTGGCAARLPSRPMGATVNRRMCGVATIAPNGRDGEQADVRRGYHRAQWARRRMCGAATIAPNGRDGEQADVQAATIAPNGRDGEQADVWRGYHRAQWARRSTGGCAARLPSRPMGATVNRRMCEAATIAPNGRDGEQADVRGGYHRAQWARRSTGGRVRRLPSRPMGATVNRQMCGTATIAPNGRDGEQADVCSAATIAPNGRDGEQADVRMCRRLPSRPMGATVNRRMCGVATIAPNGRDGEQADVRRGYHRAQWARWSTCGCAVRLPSRPMGATVNRRMCGVATIAPNGRDGRCAARLPSRPMGATVNKRTCEAATIAPNGRDGEQADVQRGYHRAQWARWSTGRCAARLPSRPMGAMVNRRMCSAATIAPNGRDGEQADVQRGYHRAQWA